MRAPRFWGNPPDRPGALARLVLPESQVGLLATRKRWTDVLILVVFAIGIAVTAYIVPPPR